MKEKKYFADWLDNLAAKRRKKFFYALTIMCLLILALIVISTYIFYSINMYNYANELNLCSEEVNTSINYTILYESFQDVTAIISFPICIVIIVIMYVYIISTLRKKIDSKKNE